MTTRAKTCFGLAASLVLGAAMSGCIVSKKQETVEKPVEKEKVIVERPVEREHVIVTQPASTEHVIIHEHTYP